MDIPETRCGECRNCQQVELAKRSVLRCARPAGPGIDQDVVDFWNSVLEDSPCLFPGAVRQTGTEKLDH